MKPEDLLGILGVPFVVAFVEVVKIVFPNLPARFYPTIAIAFAEALNIALAAILNLDYGTQALIGFAVGVFATISFAYGKNREVASNALRSSK